MSNSQPATPPRKYPCPNCDGTGMRSARYAGSTASTCGLCGGTCQTTIPPSTNKIDRCDAPVCRAVARTFFGMRGVMIDHTACGPARWLVKYWTIDNAGGYDKWTVPSDVNPGQSRTWPTYESASQYAATAMANCRTGLVAVSIERDDFGTHHQPAKRPATE